MIDLSGNSRNSTDLNVSMPLLSAPPDVLNLPGYLIGRGVEPTGSIDAIRFLFRDMPGGSAKPSGILTRVITRHIVLTGSATPSGSMTLRDPNWLPLDDGLNWKGEYSDVTVYAEGDVVLKHGSGPFGYVARVDNPLAPPPDPRYWMRINDKRWTYAGQTGDTSFKLAHDFVTGHTYEVAVVARAITGETEGIDDSPKKMVTIQGRTVAPNEPNNLKATTGFKSVFLTWTNPDDPDFDVIEIWRADTNNRAGAVLIATIRGDSYTDGIGETGVTKYYWIRAKNTSGKFSAYFPSSEVNGVIATTGAISHTDINDFSVKASKLFLNIPVLEGDAWNDNTPGAGLVTWNQHKVFYGGNEFVIAGGSTGDKYIYWKYPMTSYLTSSTNPVLYDGEFIIATNVNGYHDLAWNAIANQVIGSAYIQDAAIVRAKIADLAVDNAKIADATIESAKIKSLSADKITLTSGKYWAAEEGATNGAYWSTNLGGIPSRLQDYAPDNSLSFTGTFLGFHATGDNWPVKIVNDNGTGKLYAGNGSNKYISWDGTDLTVQGKIRTASANKRIEIDNANNNMKLYGADGKAKIVIDDDSNGYIIIGDPTVSVSNLGDGFFRIATQNYTSGISSNTQTGTVFFINAKPGGIASEDVLTVNGNSVQVGSYSDVPLIVNKGDVKITVNTKGYYVGGKKVVGAQMAAIADASETLASLKSQLNSLLAALRSHGLIASS